jgi:hypothetical protein
VTNKNAMNKKSAIEKVMRRKLDSALFIYFIMLENFISLCRADRLIIRMAQ